MSGTTPANRGATVRGSHEVMVLATGRSRMRRGGARRLATAVALVVAAAVGVSSLSVFGHSLSGRSTKALTPVAAARRDARSFLSRYVAADGRVVRRDQGDTTVSEGQGYALLLAVALGDRRTFARVWRWDEHHLQLPDGLFAYLWENGSVASTSPATDADLDTAWALVLAGRRFADRAYAAEGSRVAAAVLADETVTVPAAATGAGARSRAVELVAGPWARAAPFKVNPSYLAPEAMAALAMLTGDREWVEVESDSLALLRSLQGDAPTHLLPNWASVSVTGSAAPAPSTPGARPLYGLTAERDAVWYAADCSPGARSVARSMWGALRRLRGRGGRIAYSLDGAARSPQFNPLGFVASAAAAAAAGRKRTARSLLARADSQNAVSGTYYGGAWVALGRVLLDTTWLSPCPPL